jgi:integrase
MGLGPYPEVSLADARRMALEKRRALKVEKIDPLVARRATEAEAARSAKQALTFKVAAEALIESKRPGWRNAHHAWQWENTLQTLAYPKLGELDVQAIDTAAVIAVLKPIWTTTTLTASRLRQRIESVLDYATALGRRSGDNPARWRGHLDHLLPKPAKVKQVEHLPALDWRQVPAFMADLKGPKGMGANALAFAILTAVRSGEVRGMTWAEVDDDVMVWTVPGDRMKAERERAPGAAHASGACAAWSTRPRHRVGVPEPEQCREASLRRCADSHPPQDGPRRHHGARVPLDLPGLGRRDDGASARGHRDGAGASTQRQG